MLQMIDKSDLRAILKYSPCHLAVRGTVIKRAISFNLTPPPACHSYFNHHFRSFVQFVATCRNLCKFRVEYLVVCQVFTSYSRPHSYPLAPASLTLDTCSIKRVHAHVKSQVSACIRAPKSSITLLIRPLNLQPFCSFSTNDLLLSWRNFRVPFLTPGSRLLRRFSELCCSFVCAL